MNNITIINDDNSFLIAISDIENIDNYFQFKLHIKCSVFNASTIAYSSIDELCRFKEDLKQISEKRVRTILFSPLGKFWNFNFLLKEKDKDIVLVKGGISDLERDQSDLEFCGHVSINNLLRAFER